MELDWSFGAPRVRQGAGLAVLAEVDGVPIGRLVEGAVEIAGPGYQDLFLENFPALFRRTAGRRLPPLVRLVLDTSAGSGVPAEPESPGVRGRRARWALTTRGKRLRALRLRDEARRTRGAGWLAGAAPAGGLQVPLVDRRAGRAPAAWLDGAAARRDLEVLAGLLASRFAYLDAAPGDPRPVLAALAAATEEGLSRRDFAVQIGVLLAGLDDLHTRVVLSASGVDLPGEELPFLLVEVEEGIACLRRDGRGFADPEHPLLTAVGGVGVENLLVAAGRPLPRLSAAFHRAASVRRLRRVGLAARLGAVELTDHLTLSSADGASRVRLRWRDAPEAPAGSGGGRPYGTGVRPVETRVLPGGIGLLGLRAGLFGTPEFRRWLGEALRGLRRMRGLVLDLRDNPGGSRAALPDLVAFFSPRERTPLGAGAVRMDRAVRPPARLDLLRTRGAFALASDRWTDADRAALGPISARFRPAFELPAERFSALHFALARRDAGPAPFLAPVVILQNEATASAAAVLAALLGRLPHVTVMGRPSAGGSGYPLRYRLPESGVVIQLSSVASFDPDGWRFAGAAPDVAVRSTLADLRRTLSEGADPWLEQALTWLARSSHQRFTTGPDVLESVGLPSG